ncbi:MAG: fatty acid desaturase [Cyanothece sp. SIO1E1]|nr:fatty acid desaturase [Cyanothece sp. SIO1E1]
MVTQVKTQFAPSQPQSRQLLTTEQLSTLNARSNRLGIVQLARHLSVIGLSGYIWLIAETHTVIRIFALIIYGFSLAAMFAPLHESCHRTAFANNRLNDIVAWWAGVLSFYNSTFYRRYHKWHHRYTQIIGQDPELEDPKPSSLGEYLREISGFNWWIGKLKGHYRAATGKLENCPYIATAAREEVVRSTRLQIALYLSAIALSTALGQPGLIIYSWLLPLAVGQPFLRFILLAEHTGCSYDSNSLTNTRTTLTGLPLRLIMWNMPFHSEHHLYPSIPFHQLPQAHQHLKAHFVHVELGYLKVNRDIVAGLQ